MTRTWMFISSRNPGINHTRKESRVNKRENGHVVTCSRRIVAARSIVVARHLGISFVVKIDREMLRVRHVSPAHASQSKT